MPALNQWVKSAPSTSLTLTRRVSVSQIGTKTHDAFANCQIRNSELLETAEPCASFTPSIFQNTDFPLQMYSLSNSESKTRRVKRLKRSCLMHITNTFDEAPTRHLCSIIGRNWLVKFCDVVLCDSSRLSAIQASFHTTPSSAIHWLHLEQFSRSCRIVHPIFCSDHRSCIFFATRLVVKI